jgi:hypothetical protein
MKKEDELLSKNSIESLEGAPPEAWHRPCHDGVEQRERQKTARPVYDCTGWKSNKKVTKESEEYGWLQQPCVG